MLTSKSSVWRCPSVWLVAEGSRRRGSRALSSWRTLREYRARNSELGVPRFSPADRQAIPTSRQACIAPRPINRRSGQVHLALKVGHIRGHGAGQTPRPDSQVGISKVGFLVQLADYKRKRARAAPMPLTRTCANTRAAHAPFFALGWSARRMRCTQAQAARCSPGCRPAARRLLAAPELRPALPAPRNPP